MPRLLLCAAEPSGDLLASEVLTELCALVPDLQVRGLAGPRMRAAGVEPEGGEADLGAVGLVEGLAVAARARRTLAALTAVLDAWQPHAVLTVDSPGLLLRLAGRARARGIPAVHAVSPQVWAWRPGRVRSVARAVDLLLCLFPMEPPLYAGTGLDARFVGHPVLDRVAWRDDRGTEGVLALLPGSRQQEVRRLWPALSQAALAVNPTRTEVPVAEGIDPAWLSGLSFRRVPGLSDLTAAAALACSGTATLELAAMGLPMAVAYQVHPLTHLVARAVVTTPWIALPNIVLGRQVVPEHVQHLDPAALAREAQRLMGPDGDRQRQDLQEVRAALGEPGATREMAVAVAEVISLRRGACAPGRP